MEPTATRRTRTVSKVHVYVSASDGYTMSPAKGISNPHDDIGKAKAAVRKWLSEGNDIGGEVVFVRILERATPTVERVTKVTI